MSAGPGKPTALFKGRQWRRLLRIDRAAWLTVKGIDNHTIANQIGIHVQTLIYLKQTPEFKAKMVEYQTGIVSQHNIDIREDVEFQKAELDGMVPMALMKLRELALSSNQAIALKASQDILQRQGDHAIVSRSKIDIREQIDLTATNKVSESILDVLRAQPSPAAPSQQDSDIIDEFTKGAMDATTQVQLMHDQINEDTLEQIDAAKLSVQ